MGLPMDSASPGPPTAELMRPRHLMLIRHAEAARAGADQPDFNRPLTPDGQRDAEHLAAWIGPGFPAPDAIVTSPAPRALATAECLAAAWPTPPPITVCPELYEAPLNTPLHLISELPPHTQHVIVVGHNPSLSHAADWLLGEPVVLELAPGSLAWLTLDLPDWKEIAPGTARLHRHLTPNTMHASKGTTPAVVASPRPSPARLA